MFFPLYAVAKRTFVEKFMHLALTSSPMLRYCLREQWSDNFGFV